ncbi:hypothetical protein BCR42DRAFT_429134 [Absidia repens]|uniref:Uncharacterized protein n=1 Tax=Absidia repens TaxID=90262 RepID=A0A1X2HXM5_9FUNG|nr:hypothetical protein BCR42DRAFT_429134 [Absidia repens]
MLDTAGLLFDGHYDILILFFFFFSLSIDLLYCTYQMNATNMVLLEQKRCMIVIKWNDLYKQQTSLIFGFPMRTKQQHCNILAIEIDQQPLILESFKIKSIQVSIRYYETRCGFVLAVIWQQLSSHQD